MQWSNTHIYLAGVAGITAFRVFMYVFFKEYVTKVKVTKIAWEDPKIREVMNAQTTTILMLMAYRLMAVVIAMGLEESLLKEVFCKFNLLFDAVLFLSQMGIFHKVAGTKPVVMIHNSTVKPPVVLQLLLVVVGTYLLYI